MNIQSRYNDEHVRIRSAVKRCAVTRYEIIGVERGRAFDDSMPWPAVVIVVLKLKKKTREVCSLSYNDAKLKCKKRISINKSRTDNVRRCRTRTSEHMCMT